MAAPPHLAWQRSVPDAQVPGAIRASLENLRNGSDPPKNTEKYRAECSLGFVARKPLSCHHLTDGIVMAHDSEFTPFSRELAHEHDAPRQPSSICWRRYGTCSGRHPGVRTAGNRWARCPDIGASIR